ncbi:MAG: hypothetical protein J6T44_11905 [Prevotella sp.]|nr:hypothetical protein [Prevotella sp.]
MMSQNISSGQMDERFNDGKMPYGWFAKGWVVKDNVAQKGEDSEESGGFNFADLLGGGDDSYNYLMTPPLSVQGSEVLVFSAKKGGDDSGMTSFMGGESDSTFVVERAIYGEHRWVKVADLTSQLDSTYKTFTISNTEAGEYRFRFRAGGNVMIDSVAGFHIDNDAPDIYPAYKDKNIQPVDLGLCTEDTTVTFCVINTGTGTLTVNLSAESPFTLDQTSVSVEYADTAKVNLTFNYGQGHEGRNSTMLVFATTDERVEEIPLPIDAIITQPGVWTEDFNNNELPYGWFTEGWEVKEGVATVKNGGGDNSMSMFGGSSETYYLMTPPLTVSDETDVLLFSVKKPGSGGMDFSSMMGGGDNSATFFVEKSVYGSGKWERAKDFSNAVDTAYTTQWLSNLEPGEYRFRFVASDSIVIDSVAGFQIDMNAPDLYVTLDSAAVKSLDFGMLRADTTSTFTVINTGTGTLDVAVSSLDPTRLALDQSSLSIAAGDSLLLNATLLRDDERQGEVRELLMFTPADERVSGQAIAFSAYIIKSDSWSEDFEPIYVIEDQTFPRRFPEGWESTGWILTEGGSDDIMSMFSGGGEEKSWVAKTESKEYEVITPRLQAKQGNLLRFTADMGGGFMQMFAMFGLGGGDISYLNVYYKRDYDKDWTLYNTYFQSDTIVFKAPYSGFYRLKFQGSGVSLDDFLGFSLPKDSVQFVDFTFSQKVLDELNGQISNSSYDRVVSAVVNEDGTESPVACTVSLPYDFDIDEYYVPGTAQAYQLEYVDTVYRQFIFKELPNNKMEAWKPYLVIVNHGDLRFNAIDALFTNQVPEGSPVYDFSEWYWHGNNTEVGKWVSAYRVFMLDKDELIYGLTDKGIWAYIDRRTSQERFNNFRGLFSANDPDYLFILSIPFRQNPEVVEYQHEDVVSEARNFTTRFYQPDGEVSGEVEEKSDLLYIADFHDNGTTGIKPTIQTIDRDGTRRYFDLQGRQLNDKRVKGIYIENGKKYIAR